MVDVEVVGRVENLHPVDEKKVFHAFHNLKIT